MSTSPGVQDYTAIVPNPLSDEEVVARVKAGETALYELLMRRYNQRLFRIARSIVPDDDEAEDIMQEAYVRAFASLEQFAGMAQFSTWLAKIALYEAYRRKRKQKYLRPIDSGRIQGEDMDTVKSIAPDPEQQAQSREAISILERAIDALPEKYRSVFMLRQIEGLSTAETADCLDITEEAVKVRLLRARQMLRKELYTSVGGSGPHTFQFMGHRCDRVVRNVLSRIGPGNSRFSLYPA